MTAPSGPPPGQLAALHDHYFAATRGISERLRYVAFGTVAVVYALYSSDSAFAAHLIEAKVWALNWAGIFAIAAIAFDFFRQLCAYIASANAYDDANFDWDKKSASYRWADRFFWLGQLATLLAVIFLLLAMLGAPGARESSARATSSVAALEHALRDHVVADNQRDASIAHRIEQAEHEPTVVSSCRLVSQTWSSDGTYTRTCSER